MDKNNVIDKIMEKSNYSGLVRSDVERVYDKFSKKYIDEESLIKEIRNFLRINYSGFSGKKLFNWDDREADDILRKHLSTRERFDYYDEIYERVLKRMPKEISIIDLGAGVNGFSYHFLSKGRKVNYLSIEAVGQLAILTENYFEKAKIKNAKSVHGSLFERDHVLKLMKEMKGPRVVFMFKVVDALEKMERDYTKIFLKEIMPLVDRVVISFATESWFKRKKFLVQRTWLVDFIKDCGWSFKDDFNLGGERYLVIEKE